MIPTIAKIIVLIANITVVLILFLTKAIWSKRCKRLSLTVVTAINSVFTLILPVATHSSFLHEIVLHKPRIPSSFVTYAIYIRNQLPAKLQTAQLRYVLQVFSRSFKRWNKKERTARSNSAASKTS